MKAKDHYDNHLAKVYAWMAGDFHEKQQEQETFFRSNGIIPRLSKTAIDLGAGHGLQSVSLAKIGFSVKAVDFNTLLLEELKVNGNDHDIAIIESDLLAYQKDFTAKVELIVCMGDTLTHLESVAQAEELIRNASRCVEPGGKIVLSFRDLTQGLHHTQRFIPVKNDDTRILTCFLEYFPDHVMVHDILYEKQNGKWNQNVSAYPKLRLNEKIVTGWLEQNGFRMISSQVLNRMIYLVAGKE